MVRNASDYDDMFIVSKSETAEQLSNADYIYDVICRYVTQRAAQL
jgi:hypothetical protein